MNLFITELRRFWGRRITWGVIVITVLLMILAAVITFTQSSTPGEDSRQRAVEEAARNTQACTESSLAELSGDTEYRGDPFLEDLQEDMSEEELADFIATEYCYQDPDWYDEDNTFYATLLLGNETADWSESRGVDGSYSNRPGIREAKGGLTGIIPSIAVFFLVISVVIGASFVGAEYKFGTVENLLLWEPRRTRVLLTKFAAGFVSSAALTFVVLGILSALLYFVASIRGSTAGIDGRFWIDLLSVLGRSALTGGMFFIIAMSVAVIARNTTASVGVILGWFVISNIVIEIAAKWFRQWELFMNATAFIAEADAVKYQKFQGYQDTVYGHSYLTAGLLVAVWAAVLAAAAMLAFNRRDVD